MKIEQIVSSLTVEEKCRLLNGQGSWFTYDCNKKLPSIMMTDGPHGLRKQQQEDVKDINNSEIATCFPTACATGSSWDKSVLSRMADAIADEALKEKISIVLGPGINIKRSPLCGRNFEYFSEDPYLSGELAISFVDAMQKKGVGTSLKHFAVNSQETRRMACDSRVDERALREIYLSAFEAVVKNSQPTTIMASYNKVNGEYATQNKHLLQEILRDEWGFKGAVISDWGATNDVVECIRIGLDLEMPDSSNRHTSQLLQAVNNNELTIAELDRAVYKVVELIMSQASKIVEAQVDYDKQHQIARQLECESAVLLKNDGILPIKKNEKVLVVGQMAERMRFQGAGSSHINTRPCINAIEALRNKGVEVTYLQGYSVVGDKINVNMETLALKQACEFDKILFFGGLTDGFEGEGYDRTTLQLPKCQLNLLSKLHQLNKNIVFVAFGGSPFEVPFIGNISAFINMYLGGQAVGEACADLLVGDVNPSGRLSETYPLKLSDTPCYKYFANKMRSVEMRESIFVGYRYYDSFNIPTLFDFGYGLSYTTFKYSNLKLDRSEFSGGKLVVTVDVTNSGDTDGKEVVQLYVGNPKAKYLRANKELKAFTKIELKSEETKTVRLELDERSFSIFDTTTNSFIMPTGEYTINIAKSVRNVVLSETVAVKGVDYDVDVSEKLSQYFNNSKVFEVSDQQFIMLSNLPLISDAPIKRGQLNIHHTLEQASCVSLLARIFIKVATRMVKTMAKAEDPNDPSLKMLVMALVETPMDSLITMSNGVFDPKYAEAILLDGNGHFFKGLFKMMSKK